jgi:hypothetical protein
LGLRQLLKQGCGPLGRRRLRSLGRFALTGDLGGLEVLKVTADHPVQPLGGVPVAGLLGTAKLEEVDRHQLDLHEVRALVEHEVLVELADDGLEERTLLRREEAVGVDAVAQAVLVARDCAATGPRLGRLADLLLGRGVAVPAFELTRVVFSDPVLGLVVCHGHRIFRFGISGFGAEGEFRPLQGKPPRYLPERIAMRRNGFLAALSHDLAHPTRRDAGKPSDFAGGHALILERQHELAAFLVEAHVARHPEETAKMPSDGVEHLGRQDIPGIGVRPFHVLGFVLLSHG